MVGGWTIGPVAYYGGQVSDDTSSAFYGGAINVNRYDTFAAGALVGYDFGPAALTAWATEEIWTRASEGSYDGATFTKGHSVFAQLSYRLWAPESKLLPNKPPPPK